MGYGMNHKIKKYIRTGTVLCLAGLFFVFSGQSETAAEEMRTDGSRQVFLLEETAEPVNMGKSGNMAEPVTITLNAQSAVLMDADTGRILYGSHPFYGI